MLFAERLGQGRFDFPGGIAAADVKAMLDEESLLKANSQVTEPVSLYPLQHNFGCVVFLIMDSLDVWTSTY